VLTAKQSRLLTSQGCSRATQTTAVATKREGGLFLPEVGYYLRVAT